MTLINGVLGVLGQNLDPAFLRGIGGNGLEIMSPDSFLGILLQQGAKKWAKSQEDARLREFVLRWENIQIGCDDVNDRIEREKNGNARERVGES